MSERSYEIRLAMTAAALVVAVGASACSGSGAEVIEPKPSPAPTCDRLYDVGTVLLDAGAQQLLIDGDPEVATLVKGRLTAEGTADPVIVVAVAHDPADVRRNLEKFGQVGQRVYGLVIEELPPGDNLDITEQFRPDTVPESFLEFRAGACENGALGLLQLPTHTSPTTTA